MSDAMTDILRDEKRGEILDKIKNAEADFFKNPSKTTSEILISLWEEYISIPRGYFTTSNKAIAYEQIGHLKEYQQTGEVNWTRQELVSNAKEFNDVIRVGNGFISKGSIDEWLMSVIKESLGNPDYKQFKISLRVESITETSCKDCPCFSYICGEKYGCESKNLTELKTRKEMVLYGKG